MIQGQVLALAMSLAGLPGLPQHPGPTDWAMYQKDWHHTGSVEVPNWNGQLKKCFEIQLPIGTDSIPIVVGDYIFLNLPGRLQARNRFNGDLIWDRHIGSGNDSTASLAYDDGRIIFYSKWGVLYAFDAHTGENLWVNRVAVVNSHIASPIIIDGLVYVVTPDGDLVALDAASGTELWRMVFSTPLLSSPAYDEGILYFGTNDRRIVGINLATQEKVLDKTLLGLQIWSSPTISDGMLYIGSHLGKVFGFSLEHQYVKWTRQLPGDEWAWIHGGLSVQGDLLAVTSDNRFIFFFDKKTSLDICDPFETDDNYSHMSPIIVEGDVMAAGCTGGTHLVDLDECKGEHLDEDPDCGIWSSLVSKEGWVYGIDRCGKLDIWCPVFPTSTPTPSVTATPTPTPTASISPTSTSSFTVTATPSHSLTFSATPSPSPSITPSPSFTLTETLTITPTWTLTPTCVGGPSELSVKVVFDPEVRDELSLILYANEPVDCSRTEFVVYPHSYPRNGVTITGAVQVDETTCEGYFTRDMGFGDIAKVFAWVEDNCGNKSGSDGTFEREVIPDKDVIITHNRIFPGLRQDCVGIYYRFAMPGPVKISIYSEDGNLVKVIIDEQAESGQYHTQWCGKDSRDRLVSSGVYLIVVETSLYEYSGKAVVVK